MPLWIDKSTGEMTQSVDEVLNMENPVLYFYDEQTDMLEEMED